MKNFKEYLDESLKIEKRKDGATTDPYKVPSNRKQAVIGWFSNKHNQAAGWVVTLLDSEDEKWLKSKGVALKNVYRTYSDRGNTSIAKFNFATGTYAFVDNDHLENTDEVKFEAMSKYRFFTLDDSDVAKKEIKL